MLSPFQKICRDYGLSQRETAIIRRYQGVKKNLKTACLKSYGPGKKREVLKSAAAQTDFVQAVPFAKRTANRLNHHRH